MKDVSDLLGRFTQPRTRVRSAAALVVERRRGHQAVVMCLAPTGPLYGSLADDPPFLSDRWLAILDDVCADADELGFRLWMYDQLGFSGANLQGQLTAVRLPAGHTALTAYAEIEGGSVGWDGTVDSDVVSVPVDDGVARRTGRHARLSLVHSGVSGFDYFGERACAALLDRMHGELERRVGHWFGRSIHGFFQDELPAMPTWGDGFAATFADTYGYDLLPWLWALWHGEGTDAATVRRDCQEHRARLARRAFFDPLDAWFARTGLLCGFDQPSPAREGDPAGGVQVYGDYLGTHSGYGAPGSDHWGDAKVHSSLAHAHGRPRTSVNGQPTGRLVWGPWVSDVTAALRPGVNEVAVVVRGTLAGYLDDASPTGAIAANQLRSGLFGPVPPPPTSPVPASQRSEVTNHAADG